MRLSPRYLATVALLLLAACRDSTGPKISVRDTATVLIPDETRVLTASAAGALGSVTDGRLAFGATSPDAAALQVGDIVVAGITPATPTGIIRKVTGRQVRQDSIILTTAPAKLTEAIERGQASVDAPLQLDDAPSPAVPGLTLSRATTAAGTEGISASFADFDVSGYGKLSGSIVMTPTLKIDAKFDDFALQSFTFRISAVATTKLDLKNSAKSVSLDTAFVLKTIKLRPITFLVPGPFFAIPIVVVPSVDLRIGVSGKFAAGIETGISGTYTVSQGATYANGAWTVAGETTPSFNFTAPRPKFDANAKIFAGPRFRLNLYASSLFEAYADGVVYGRADIDMVRDPLWTLSLGLQAGVGLTSSLFDQKFVNLSNQSVFTKEISLGAGRRVTITPEKLDTARKTVAQTFTAVLAGAPSQTRYTWTFNDGTATTVKVNDPSVSHVFPAEGSFEISVKVEDADKNYEVGFDTAMVKVLGAPVATVTVTPSSASVAANLSTQLSATVRDATGALLTNRVVRWSSGSPSVATVDSVSGLVRAVAQGTATITAHSEGKTGTALVSVTVPDSTEYYKQAVLGRWTVSNAPSGGSSTYPLDIRAGGVGAYLTPAPADGSSCYLATKVGNYCEYAMTWSIYKQNDRYYLGDSGFWHPAYGGESRDPLTASPSSFFTYSSLLGGAKSRSFSR